MPLSSALDLYDHTNHFLISEEEGNFKETGLKKTCYANGMEIHKTSVSALQKRIGSLKGNLARQFTDWIG